jgi:endonuclease/exonuclease/phosphatase family metal-dependent hydrolase
MHPHCRQVLRHFLLKSRSLTIVVTVALMAIPCCRHGKPHPVPLSGMPLLNEPCTAMSSDTIGLGFYNVENLFGLVDNGTEYPEFRPGAFGWNKQMYEIKVGRIASVIAAMHLDIIGLSEVQNMNTLQGLQQEIRKQGVDYPYSAIADGPNRSVNCPALLSRFPITTSEDFRALSPMITRNILEADLNCNGARLRIYVNHWPAKFHPESERLAAAQALAQRITQRGAGMPYVIIGDLNSDYDEWRTFRTRGFDDTRGLTGLNNVLGTIRSDSAGRFSFVTKADLCRGGRAFHFDPWLDVPPEKRMSMSFRGLPETPDHILLPRALLCGSTFTYCDSSFTAFNWNGRLLRDGEPFGWQMRGFGRRRFFTGEGYSDHLPVYLRLVERPEAPPARFPDTATASAATTLPQRGGFEESDEGWLATGSAFTVVRDSTGAASGRRCLCVKGAAPEKNCAAAYTVIRRPTLNRSRWSRVAFDIRGGGKMQLRMKSGRGKWRFYTGPSFRYYRSSRYLLSQFPSWRHEAISFLADNTASPDLIVELCAGKGEPLCVWLDNFVVE